MAKAPDRDAVAGLDPKNNAEPMVKVEELLATIRRGFDDLRMSRPLPSIVEATRELERLRKNLDRTGRSQPHGEYEAEGDELLALAYLVATAKGALHGEYEAEGDELPGPEEAGEAYRSLGQWKGPLASGEVQAKTRRFWYEAGERGAQWLVRRIREETSVEVLHAAASTLADLGPICLGAILVELSRVDRPPLDLALTLLQAIAWMREARPKWLEVDTPERKLIRSVFGEASDREDPFRSFFGGRSAELTLAEYLQHEAPDVREAAAKAMWILSPKRAELWLSRRSRVEPDEAVRETIADERARQQSPEF